MAKLDTANWRKFINNLHNILFKNKLVSLIILLITVVSSILIFFPDAKSSNITVTLNNSSESIISNNQNGDNIQQNIYNSTGGTYIAKQINNNLELQKPNFSIMPIRLRNHESSPKFTVIENLDTYNNQYKLTVQSKFSLRKIVLYTNLKSVVFVTAMPTHPGSLFGGPFFNISNPNDPAEKLSGFSIDNPSDTEYVITVYTLLPINEIPFFLEYL